MRGLVLAAALWAAAGPACAGKAPARLDPDPLTVSGRFELPKAAAPYAGRVAIGRIEVNPALARQARLDEAALAAALGEAATRSLRNFGYLAEPAGADSLEVDLELLGLELQTGDEGAQALARLRIAAADACLARTGEGRFQALARERSGAGRRVFAFGTSLALGLAAGPGGPHTFMTDQFALASAENQLRNAGKPAAGQGVAPRFGEAQALRFAATGAIQLALADYIRQLGAAPECRPAG